MKETETLRKDIRRSNKDLRSVKKVVIKYFLEEIKAQSRKKIIRKKIKLQISKKTRS